MSDVNSKVDLSGKDLRGTDLRGADLRGANLRWADLRGADVRGASLDYSCWTLWCGSKNVKSVAVIMEEPIAWAEIVGTTEEV
jgi:uncharacterized protein YjbI with pentapeptide repeats